MSLTRRSLVALLALAPSTLAADETPATLEALLSVRVNAASRLEQTTRRAPASVTIITAEEIERFGYRTLAEALGSVPGLYVTDDRNYSYVGVRGFSRPTDYNNRVLVLVDGYRLNEDVYGYGPIGTDLPLDLRAVERIEVVRGPGSAAFGTAAMLAVINVVLRQPRSVASTEVAVEAGSGRRYALAARGGGETGPDRGLAWSVTGTASDGRDLYYPEFDAPDTGDGRSVDTDFDRGTGATAVLRLGGLTVDVISTAREKGVPTGAWDTDFGSPDTRTADRFSLLGLRLERALGHGVSATARGQLGHFAYDGDYAHGGSVWQDSTDNAWWGGDLQVAWERSERHRLTAGLEYRDNVRADYRTFENGTVYFDADRPFQVFSLYAENELQIGENLILNLGLRHDDYPDAGSSTTPRLALVYLPDPDTSVKLLYGRAFRAPNVYETRFEQRESGIKGNPGLRPEVVETTELMVERSWRNRLHAGVAVFRSQFEDLVEQRLDPADGLYQYRNATGATSSGAEVNLRLYCCRGLMAYGSVGYQETVDDETNERLTNSPRLLAKLGVTDRLGQRWRYGTRLVHESGRLTVQGTSTDPFVRVDGSLAWQAEGPWHTELQVRNLFDETYAHPGGPEHRQAAIRQDGRSFTLRLGVRF